MLSHPLSHGQRCERVDRAGGSKADVEPNLPDFANTLLEQLAELGTQTAQLFLRDRITGHILFRQANGSEL